MNQSFKQPMNQTLFSASVPFILNSNKAQETLWTISKNLNFKAIELKNVI